MNRKISYLKSPENWAYIVEQITLYLRIKFSTFLCKIRALWWGVNLGKGCQFAGHCYFRRLPQGKIRIGNNCTFRSAFWSNTIGLKQRCFLSASKEAKLTIGSVCGFSGTVIAAANSITIGNRVMCGANCTIVDTDRHHLAAEKRANNSTPESSPIVIEDDVFLGMNVVVLKGCTIGAGTVVAANSVVTRSLPAGVMAGGIPAIVIKSLEASNQINVI